MEEITSKKCIQLMKKSFPKFSTYWAAFLRDIGSGGLHTQMIPFEEYTVDVIKSNDEIEIKKIFDFVEFLLCNGNESVQDAITTSFLEYLMSKDPDEIKFSNFVKLMGKNAIGYCRAWDRFNGIKTEGLWEPEFEQEYPEPCCTGKEPGGYIIETEERRRQAYEEITQEILQVPDP